MEAPSPSPGPWNLPTPASLARPNQECTVPRCAWKCGAQWRPPHGVTVVRSHGSAVAGWDAGGAELRAAAD